MIDDRKIICGDCLDVLKTIPDESVGCCITSPPYYGLRDYGTGKWIGGDPNCPHRRMSKFSEKTITGHAQDGLVGNVGDAIYKSVCPLCGAVREDKQIGLEESPEAYVEKLVQVFREVKRVLKNDGTLWLNIGDSYSIFSENPEIKQKDLIGIPWMTAFALRADGWYLRQDIIWAKNNPMPESVKDRCTKSHEYIFLLSKSKNYYFDYEAIQEEATGYDGRKDTTLKGSPKYANSEITASGGVHGYATSGHERWKFKNLADKGQQSHTMHERRAEGMEDIMYPIRNKRDVWNISVQPTKEAHFATFPEKLVEPCILAGCREGGNSVRSVLWERYNRQSGNKAEQGLYRN